MFRSLLLLGASLALAAPSPAARRAVRTQAEPRGAAKWERMTYPGEEFSAEWPEPPFVFHDRRPVYGSDKSEEMRVFGLYHDGVVYMVFAMDKPRADETLDFFAGIQSGGKPPAVTGDKLTLNGFEGREYDTRFGIDRVFRARRHAYLVRVVAAGGKDHPAIRRFLDSLALGQRPGGTEIGRQWYERRAGASSGGGPATNPVTVRLPGEPFKANELAHKAIIFYKPPPGFTEEARKNEVAGLVRLRAVLSSDGRVTNISVVKGLPDGLTEKAIAAAYHILFFPAEKDGRRVSQWVTLEYNFNIY